MLPVLGPLQADVAEGELCATATRLKHSRDDGENVGGEFGWGHGGQFYREAIRGPNPAKVGEAAGANQVDP